jgi:hypothetical protein
VKPQSAWVRLANGLGELGELEGWRFKSMDLGREGGIEAQFQSPNTTAGLSFKRLGSAPYWREIGPFSVTILGSKEKLGFPRGLLNPLARRLAECLGQSDCRWPEWQPTPSVMLVISGIPRSGTSWINRTIRTLLQACGHPDAAHGARGDYPSRTLDDAEMVALKQTIACHTASPDRVWQAKAHYFSHAPVSDHPSIRTFFVYRDLRDVALSQTHWARHGPQAKQFGSESFDAAFERVCAAVLPVAVESLRIAVAGGLPDNLSLVRYDNLVSDYRQQLERLIAFMGMSIPVDFLHPIVAKHSFQRESGRLPGEELVASYHRKGIVGDWKNSLTAAQVSMVHSYADDLDELLVRADKLAL